MDASIDRPIDVTDVMMVTIVTVVAMVSSGFKLLQRLSNFQRTLASRLKTNQRNMKKTHEHNFTLMMLLLLLLLPLIKPL